MRDRRLDGVQGRLGGADLLLRLGPAELLSDPPAHEQRLGVFVSRLLAFGDRAAPIGESVSAFSAFPRSASWMLSSRSASGYAAGKNRVIRAAHRASR